MMTEAAGNRGDSRTFSRVALAPMYTMIRVRLHDASDAFTEIGHIYDISESGIRFELDHEIPNGSRVDIRALLPGPYHTTIRATGHVVRRHDDSEEQGPVRMGLAFDRFTPESDYDRLQTYLRQQEVRKAA